jgi:hypothetical protein
MKKLLLTIFTCVSLNATVEYVVKDDINKLDISLADGTSGVVVNEYGFEKQSITAVAIVKNGAIEYKEYNNLEQTSVPSLKKSAKKDDKILFEYLYDEVLLIAPNKDIYNSIKQIKRDKNFKSSDLFAGFLSMENDAQPSKEYFQEFAKIYHVGLIYFAVDNYIYEVDVNSFTILNKVPFKFFNEDIKLPFFSNISHISTNVLYFNSDVDDYNEHYKELLGL